VWWLPLQDLGNDEQPDTSSAAVALYDENLRYITVGGENVNRVALTVDNLEGSELQDAVPDELGEQMTPHYRAAIEEEEQQTFEPEYDGTYYLFRALPVRDEEGNVYAGMSISQDITDRQEYQRRLEESNERLEQFAHAASHDLQEPLRMISSYLQPLENRDEDDLDEEAREFIEFAVDGADRMRTMVDALLEYSRIESRGEPFEPVDLDAVLASVREDLQVELAESDADLTVEELPRVEGDANQLRQLFQNLLDNAIEYSGDAPPRIHVSAERTGSEWVVSVQNEGSALIRTRPTRSSRCSSVSTRTTSTRGPGSDAPSVDGSSTPRWRPPGRVRTRRWIDVLVHAPRCQR
jgi:signal transduction histidine kinase